MSEQAFADMAVQWEPVIKCSVSVFPVTASENTQSSKYSVTKVVKTVLFVGSPATEMMRIVTKVFMC